MTQDDRVCAVCYVALPTDYFTTNRYVCNMCRIDENERIKDATR